MQEEVAGKPVRAQPPPPIDMEQAGKRIIVYYWGFLSEEIDQACMETFERLGFKSFGGGFDFVLWRRDLEFRKD